MASASLSGFSMGFQGTYRPQLPLPPVTYPPCCGDRPTLKYFLQSKILALAFLILGIGFLVALICAFLPFWFIFEFNIADSTFGTEGLRQLRRNLGIYFYDDVDYVSILFLESISNKMTTPMIFTMAELFEMFGICGMFLTFGGAGILACRKYSSVTGVLFLAALGTVTALCKILMVVFCFITVIGSSNGVCEATDDGCSYRNNLVWRNLPFYEQYKRANPYTTPRMTANWAYYIAIIGAALSVVGCILLWIEGLSICKAISNIRYHQLRSARDVYENEREPSSYIYSPPKHVGSSGFVVQPVSFAPARGTGHLAPPREAYRSPRTASETSSQSGSAYVSREIDL